MIKTFTAEGEKIRLDAFLVEQLPDLSRSQIQKIIERGQATVDGEVVKSSSKVFVGNKVSLELPDELDFSNFSLPVIYEDDDVIVINKPSGILTHSKGAENSEFTVAEFVRSKISDESRQGNRPGIVHRLDRVTSGVIIAAKNAQAKSWLQKQFSQRKTKKIYVALVDGHPKEPSATLQLPIERNPKKPQTFRVGGNGKDAQTFYKTIKDYSDFSFLELHPYTGRTHQLRVHMRHLGCPITGDELYGQFGKGLKRIFLHARSLEITLPNRQRVIFEAPLPAELEGFLEVLDKNERV